jgi:hypothetical protein
MKSWIGCLVAIAVVGLSGGAVYADTLDFTVFPIASLERLFPSFGDADHDRWDGVIRRALLIYEALAARLDKGQAIPLSALGQTAELIP